MVARSFARDLWHAMTTAAEQYGYEVRTPAPYR
jgi:sarcosine oxidase gamma subunit